MNDHSKNHSAHSDPIASQPLAARLLALHRSCQQYLDDDLAPDVDHDLIRRLVRNELSAADARLVYELVHAFKAWDEAHTTVIVDEFREHRPK